MKILVTGATGFIGKNLVKRLLEKEHDVTCLVRKTSKVDFLKKERVPLVASDITDEGELKKVFDEVHPEVVFHCAAEVKDGDEVKLYEINGTGTRNICNACYTHGVKRLIYLSSVAVVSGNKKSPLTDDLPFKASNAYGRSKIEAERMVMDFRNKGLNVAVVRPCMVYGEDEPHALDKLFREVMSRHIPVLDFSGMDSQLQLVSVENVVQVLELALYKEEALQGTFMVADKEVITIRRFLEILYDGLGAGWPPVIPAWVVRVGMFIPFIKEKTDRYFKDRTYDISRARNILRYDPKVSTEEGLRSAIERWKKTCLKSR